MSKRKKRRGGGIQLPLTPDRAGTARPPVARSATAERGEDAEASAGLREGEADLRAVGADPAGPAAGPREAAEVASQAEAAEAGPQAEAADPTGADPSLAPPPPPSAPMPALARPAFAPPRVELGDDARTTDVAALDRPSAEHDVAAAERSTAEYVVDPLAADAADPSSAEHAAATADRPSAEHEVAAPDPRAAAEPSSAERAAATADRPSAEHAVAAADRHAAVDPLVAAAPRRPLPRPPVGAGVGEESTDNSYARGAVRQRLMRFSSQVPIARASTTPPPPPRVPPPVRPPPTPVELAPGTEVTGELLRQLREQRGVSLKEIEETSRVRAVSLAAVEAERFADLPDVKIYIRGFVQALASAIGLDPEAAATSYLTRWEHHRQRTPAPKRHFIK